MPDPKFTPTHHGAGRVRPSTIERRPHPWGQVQIVEQTPAAINSMIGNHRARRREFESHRGDYSNSEFDRELERLSDHTRKQIVSRVEMAQAEMVKAHALVERTEKAHPAVPAADVDRAWAKVQPLLAARIPLGDIARRFAADRATSEAVKEYGPTTSARQPGRSTIRPSNAASLTYSGTSTNSRNRSYRLSWPRRVRRVDGSKRWTTVARWRLCVTEDDGRFAGPVFT